MEVTSLGDNLVRVSLKGRLDAAGVSEVELELTAKTVSAGKSAIVDMSGVSYIASLGIAMFVTIARTLSRKKAGIILFGCQPMVQETLRTGIVDLIPIVDDEDAALAALD